MVKKKSNVTKTKKKSVKLPFGTLFVNTSVNNTIITLADEQGNKVSWWGTWLVGFKWTKQSTPYAAEMLARSVLQEARDSFWLKELGIVLEWLWLGRDWVFKAINDLWGMDITYIKEKTSLQFGWCKGVRQRRN